MDAKARFSVMGFRILPWNEDPLRGAYGLSWFERKPSSLSGDERKKLMEALQRGQISAWEYSEWEMNVR